MRFLLVCLSVTILSGCAGMRIMADVTAFHEMTPATGERIAVLSWRDDRKDTLEFKTYAKAVEQQLASKGFVVVPIEEKPSLIAFLDYGIDDGRQVTSSYAIPQYGVTGYGPSYTTGTITSYGNMATYSGTTTRTPQYGVTGYTTGITTDTVYTRFINLDVVRVAGGANKKIYEGRLKSQGSCGNIAPLFPTLAGMMFKEFPGNSGQARRVVEDFDPKVCR